LSFYTRAPALRDENLELRIPAVDVVTSLEDTVELSLGVLECFYFPRFELLADLKT
jgi:hypothetical protein